MTTTDFLIIEPFLHDAIQARTLQAAFELGIIDALESNVSLLESQLLRGRSCDAAGGEFLLQVLARSGVVHIASESIRLTDTFRSALRFGDLLLTKLQSSELVAADFFNRMPQLLNSPEEFMETSKLFELFDVGTRHIAEQQMSDRIQFHPLNFSQDPIPDGHDLITCKSVLHDWPDEYANHRTTYFFATLAATAPVV